MGIEECHLESFYYYVPLADYQYLAFPQLHGQPSLRFLDIHYQAGISSFRVGLKFNHIVVGNCGGLKRYGPHRCMCLSASPIGNDTIRRCNITRGSVPLWEWTLRTHMLKLHPRMGCSSFPVTCRSQNCQLPFQDYVCFMLPCFLLP